jgi:hypothetical protein
MDNETQESTGLKESAETGLAVVARVEKSHFRTNHDTGANLNVLMIWNMVRKHFGLPRLELDDLPKYCVKHDRYDLCHKPSVPLISARVQHSQASGENQNPPPPASSTQLQAERP